MTARRPSPAITPGTVLRLVGRIMRRTMLQVGHRTVLGTALGLVFTGVAHGTDPIGTTGFSAPPAFVRFETRTDVDGRERDGEVIARCVAIHVAERWLLSAAHCLGETVLPLFLACTDENARRHPLSPGRVVRHPTHDAVLLEIDAPPDCLGVPLSLARELAPDARLSSRVLPPVGGADARDDGRPPTIPPGDLIPFVELGRDAHVLRLDDRAACLGRGDSGYPVFATATNGDEALVAMLIGGTEGCPSLQTVLRLDRLAPWVEETLGLQPDDTPARSRPEGEGRSGGVTTEECEPHGCLLIDETAGYCSIDPEQSASHTPFATKARLTLPAARYAPDAEGRIRLPWVGLHTSHGETRLYAQAPAGITPLPEDGTRDDRSAPARLELEGRFGTTDGTSLELVLIADRIAGRRYGLGDPDDAETFLTRGRHLLLRADGTTSRSPFAEGVRSIAFAPCALSTRPDERFVFTLADGTVVTVTLRSAVGAHQLGFYIGRVLEASIATADGTTHVGDHDRLAFIGGSRQIGEPSLPTLAVGTEPRADGCGYLFDATLWDSPAARDGYVVRRLGCDEAPGESLALVSAHYPERYTLP